VTNRVRVRVFQNSFFAVLCVLSIVLMLVAVAKPAQGQKYSVIHSFTGPDGANPFARPTIDRAGNLFGTTYAGGASGDGEVFKLTRTSRGWVLTPLYSFVGGSDGMQPNTSVMFGPDGSLYGTTHGGGGTACNGGYGCGVVFKLTPPLTICKSTLCPWIETVLYRFLGGNDGRFPSSGVAFDQAGNLYGSTLYGGGAGCGGDGCGTVYQLARSGSGWTESVIYSFAGGADGEVPTSGLTLDRFGNLYGVTEFGGIYGSGDVYELTSSGSGWTQTILYSLDGSTGDPEYPSGDLIFDSAGNLYGGSPSGGSGGGGTVFMLTPSPAGWTETTIWNFSGVFGAGPGGGVTIDPAGNLFGTTINDNGAGSVFKLVFSGGAWSETDLYDFTDYRDGGHPYSGVALDANGNLFGTAADCGESCQGVVFEVLP